MPISLLKFFFEAFPLCFKLAAAPSPIKDNLFWRWQSQDFNCRLKEMVWAPYSPLEQIFCCTVLSPAACLAPGPDTVLSGGAAGWHHVCSCTSRHGRVYQNDLHRLHLACIHEPLCVNLCCLGRTADFPLFWWPCRLDGPQGLFMGF